MSVACCFRIFNLFLALLESSVPVPAALEAVLVMTPYITDQ